MRTGRIFRPRGLRPRTPSRGGCPCTPRSFFHRPRGSPPATPPQAEFRPIITVRTGGGGPKLPIPAIQVEVDRGIRWFLRRTESRPTIAHPSATLGQPPLVPPQVAANLIRPSAPLGQPSLVPPRLAANRH